MTAALYDRADDEDRQRLVDAGYVEVNYCGEVRWMAPNHGGAFSFEEAVKQLNREQKSASDG